MHATAPGFTATSALRTLTDVMNSAFSAAKPQNSNPNCLTN